MHSVDHPRPTRQRGPHNDASMLDGDSAHGNPGEPAGDEWALDTDTDVVDEAAEDELDDAVADPAPETDDEVEGGAEPDAATATTAVDPEEEADEEEIEDEDEDDDEGEDDDEEEGEEDEDEDEDEESDADAQTAADHLAAEADTVLEVEVVRQSDPTPDRAKQTAPPIDGYDALTIPQVLAKAEGLEVGRLNAVLEYERANRNRKTLVAKLTRLTTEA